MRAMIFAMIAAAGLAACASTTQAPPPAAVTADAPHIVAALADERRPQADRDRDANRRPADMLAFAGVRPGMRVGELIAGGGYFTRIFAVAVGDEGRLFVVQRPSQPNATQEPPVLAVAAQYANTTVLRQFYGEMTFPEPLDVVWTSQNYHDAHITRFGLDPAAINRRAFAALRPGGVYIVLDHAAQDGSGLRDVDSLHRIDAASVRAEVEAAGFVFDGESNALRNPADARTLSVFDESLRGHTDQFVLRFRRP